MMLRLTVILGLLLLGSSTFCQQKSLLELRTHYLTALKDCEKAPEVYDIFEKVEQPSGKILAYKGALEAILTKTTWNVFKKISYLRDSEATFAKAIKVAPNNIEIRFMRMAVQYEIPEYLGFSEDMDDDKKFIVEHINEFDTSQLDAQTIQDIFGFMNKCGRFSNDQIETFKGILALN